MKLHLDRLVDRGCWIADDRVYAFIGTGGALIGEIGFHGKQPVSRNSRLLVREEGVVTLAARSFSGKELPVCWNEADWSPSEVRLRAFAGKNVLSIVVRAAGQTIEVRVEHDGPARYDLRFRVHGDACYTDVQGERAWMKPELKADGLIFRCTDRIELASWLSREGPYAGDFLLPEPWRRILFARRVRSGTATREDLVAEMRDLPLPLYDAGTFIGMACGVRPRREKSSFVFRLPSDPARAARTPFRIQCAWSEDDLLQPARPRLQVPRFRPRRGAVPELRLAGFPAVEGFFRSVPALVESAVVRDLGVPRATPARYYWIWAWDAMVSAAEAFLWGDTSLARRTAEFVNSHRDDGGAIPARWTRSLVPMDTPPPGSFDFLLASLVWRLRSETGERQPVLDVYPHIVRLLRSRENDLARSGVPRGTGFYPDLPVQFGRTGSGSVAMEAGAWHGLSLLAERFASLLGDEGSAGLARRSAGRVHEAFDRLFWDDTKGFYIDAAGAGSGQRNRSYPLFTLLLLQAPGGISLIRKRLPRCASFISRELLSAHGMHVLPPWDKNAGSEAVSDAWYPHWDLYAVKVLRRAGRYVQLLQWLRLVETTVERLGYCPEYLSLLPFDRGAPDPWSHHGSPSNLNCVTAWYRALVEGVAGIDPDPGGLQILSGALPLGEVTLTGLHHRRSLWDITVIQEGPFLEQLCVDGREVRGCTKIPAAFHDGKRHAVRVRFGQHGSPRLFREVTEAEVISCSESGGYPVLGLRGYGAAELLFVADGRVRLIQDGRILPHEWDEEGGTGRAILELRGEHSVIMRPAGRE